MIAEFIGRARCRGAAPLVVLLLSTAIGLSGASLAQETRDDPASVRDTPEVAPQSQSGYSAIIADRYPTVRALVVARGDCIVLEYYRKDMKPKTLSPVYSVTKSVLSILVGIAIDKGYLRLDQKLSELFPEALNEGIDPGVRDVSVRDFLTMTAGFNPAGAGADGSKVALPAEQMWAWMLNRTMKYAPGTHFFYDDIGTNLLSVILSRAINQNAERFAQQVLFDPLQINDYTWISDAEGHLLGDTGLSLNARDMAKIGLLYLWHGRWRGAQIVSNAYVLDSTKKHSDGGPPVNAAYGYLWWIENTGANPGAFFAAGFKSQVIYVVPERELVAAISAESIPGGSRGFVNDIVLPAEAGLTDSAQCIARLR